MKYYIVWFHDYTKLFKAEDTGMDTKRVILKTNLGKEELGLWIEKIVPKVFPHVSVNYYEYNEKYQSYSINFYDFIITFEEFDGYEVFK